MKQFKHETWTPCHCPKAEEFGPHYVEENGLHQWVANEAAARKRLTREECAAFAWHAEAHYWSALWHHEAEPDVDFWDKAHTVWSRFAATPHAHTGEH
jgi:hypothetical protein